MQIDSLHEVRTDIPEEEATVDKGELYKRFITGIDKGTITFHKGQSNNRVRDDWMLSLLNHKLIFVHLSWIKATKLKLGVPVSLSSELSPPRFSF